MRTEDEFERALAAIAAGLSPRDCGVPRTTLQDRARRDAKFAGRLAAARQTRRLRTAAAVSDEVADRDEVLRVLSRKMREGHVGACQILLDELPAGRAPVAGTTLAEVLARGKVLRDRARQS